MLLLFKIIILFAPFQIYKTLEDLVNEEKYEEFYYRHHGGWGYGRGSQLYAALDQEEVVYEDLCSFKKSGHEQVCPKSRDWILYFKFLSCQYKLFK